MVLDKYIRINEATGIAGQRNNGAWYCKELPFNDAHDLEIKAGEVIKVLNKLNKEGFVETEIKHKS